MLKRTSGLVDSFRMVRKWAAGLLLVRLVLKLVALLLTVLESAESVEAVKLVPNSVPRSVVKFVVVGLSRLW